MLVLTIPMHMYVHVSRPLWLFVVGDWPIIDIDKLTRISRSVMRPPNLAGIASGLMMKLIQDTTTAIPVGR